MASERISCSSCGADNRADRRFCRSCGVALAPTCPVCGAAADPGDRFCGDCGATIGPDAPPATAAATPGIDRSGPDGAALERRLVSVLFADVVGSTTLADTRVIVLPIPLGCRTRRVLSYRVVAEREEVVVPLGC